MRPFKFARYDLDACYFGEGNMPGANVAEPLGNPHNKAAGPVSCVSEDVAAGLVILSPCGAKGLSAYAGRAPTDERTTKPAISIDSKKVVLGRIAKDHAAAARRYRDDRVDKG